MINDNHNYQSFCCHDPGPSRVLCKPNLSESSQHTWRCGLLLPASRRTNQDAKGRDPQVTPEYAGGGKCRPTVGTWGLSDPGSDLALPLGDLGQDTLPLSLCLSICKMGTITHREFSDFYGLTQ